MRGILTALRSSWPLIAKRSLYNWRLLSSVVLGILMASAILAGTVIYFDALKQLALRDALGELSVTEADLLLQGKRGPTDRREYRGVAAIAEGQIEANLAWMLRDTFRAGRSPTFFLSEPGDELSAGDDNARAYFAFLPRLDQYAIVPAPGRLPGSGPVDGPGERLAIEAVIPQEASELFGVGVGDRLVAVPPWDAGSPVTVVVSGVFTRQDPGDEIWHLEDRVLNAATGSDFRTAPFFISEVSYLDVLGPSLAGMESTYAWLLAVDDRRISAANSESALAGVARTGEALSGALSSYRQSTRLDDALAEYDRRLFFARLPMFVVLILIVMVILYFVASLSSLVMEDRRSDVALLRSRGASSAQVFGVFVVEGSTLALFAVIVGPMVAAVGISALGYAPGMSEVTGGARLEVSVSLSAYLMSALGGLLSFAALTLPALRLSRTGVTEHQRQVVRPSGQPIFQRYYLDVLLLLLSVVLFRQLTEQRSVVATDLLGEPVVDQLMLALPGLVLFASAMVLLRLFPVLMALASRGLSRRLPAGLTLGVWQMARNPTHYARLSLLLVLTAGLGILASSFGATLERSFDDRVMYATGSDVRVDDVRERGAGRGFRRFFRATSSSALVFQAARPTMADVYEGVPGVRKASAVMRNTAHDLSDTNGESYTILAIDGESFAEVAWYRDDFSSRPIEAMLASLKPDGPPPGIVLPGDAAKLSVRVVADRPRRGVRLTARIRNSQGRYSTYILGELSSDRWTVLETELTSGDAHPADLAHPLTLVALRVNGFGGGPELEAGSITLDEMSVTSASGERRVVESFDNASAWRVLKVGPGSASDLLRGELGSITFTWSEGSPFITRGIVHGPDLGPLPVLASEAFVRDTQHSRGEQFDVSIGGFRVPVYVVDTVDHFPTMTTPDQKYLMGDLGSIVRHANLVANFRRLEANEIWISTADNGASRPGMLEQLDSIPGYTSTSIHDSRRLLAESNVDPLVKAGWRSLLLVAFSSVLVLSCLGFLVHAYVSMRDRRHQLALLRTVGLSRGQLVSMLWLEQVLVIGMGMALGTWMGGRLGAIVMPFMGRDDFGAQVLPPFVLEVNWSALLIAYGLMVGAFAVISLGIVWLVRRLSLQRILRLGQM